MTADSSGRRSVTLAQVAKRAGVSVSAVSFVLNGRTDRRISSETSERVRQAAEELGYRPNITAKTLRTGKSGTVALVSDFVSSTSFANSMVRGALRELRNHGILLFTVDTQGDPALEDQLLQNLLDRHIDGVLYGSMFTREVELPKLLRTTPFVLLNCSTGAPDTPTVIPDEVEAGATIARVLLEAGHRDGIYFVGSFIAGMTGGAAWHGWHPLALDQRLEGIGRELAAAGTTLAGYISIEDDWDAANGRAAVADLLAQGIVPKALICINDTVAVGAYQALRAAGLSVPQDVSVTGFDGGAFADLVEPRLTTMVLPQEELGRVAAGLLLAPEPTASVHLVSMPLRKAGSVGAPRTTEPIG